jgi:hypothetical protein
MLQSSFSPRGKVCIGIAGRTEQQQGTIRTQVGQSRIGTGQFQHGHLSGSKDQGISILGIAAVQKGKTGPAQGGQGRVHSQHA